ncbi:helix-turn-helix transcriptional regulator [Arsenophonus nasoniae]|uniref:helix-turn-helix domain-containing protein n=1 Tax=Arsenophonus nasoniae TaxID=638 RepID=UPI0031451D81
MTTLSRNYSQKLKIIRKAEGLTQLQFAKITGLSLGTVKRYEVHLQTARAEIMEKVLLAPEFRKYTMWLLHDETAPSIGQISPILEEETGS